MPNNHINKFPKEVILWGGAGQAIVMKPIIEYYGSKVIAIFDYTKGLKSPFKDIPLYHDSRFKEWLKNKNPKKFGFLVCIGNRNPLIDARRRISEMLIKEDLIPITVAHHTAFIAEDAEIGKGCQIHPGAIIMPRAKLGNYCIINTKASVDHECVLEDGVEIAPGATLCGLVNIGLDSWIASGAVVLPKLKIGKSSIIGAGAVVIKDVPDNTIVVGVPAKPINKE